uniref:(California timema) hypothetical protein n=1 Tax=Timema californicum TaxID=61474 RepID=A0A7R9JGP0_TIMCA|nr:unnamed protein product [Timema californicum]
MSREVSVLHQSSVC